MTQQGPVTAQRTVLTPEQVASLVLASGFTDPVRATAVVLGESGGDTGIVSPRNTNGTIDVGLWQINSGHFPGGAYDAGKIDQAGAVNPVLATRFAYQLSKGGTDFSPWAATRRASFTGHLKTADAAVAAARAGSSGSSAGGAAGWRLPGVPFDLPGPSDIPGVDTVTGGVLGAGKAAGEVFELGAKLISTLLDPDFWKRLGLGLLGVSVVIGGVIIWQRKTIGAGLMAAPHPAAKAGGAVLSAGAEDGAADAGKGAKEVAEQATKET